MKRTLLVLSMFALLLGAQAAFAETPFKATVGVKSWYNSWEHTITFSDGTSKTWDNGSSFMVGPSLNFKLGGAFLGGSFLKSTDDYEAPDWITIGDKMQFEREDTDLTLGYMFLPYFGAFVGYKQIEADMTYYDLTGAHFPFHDGKWKMSGPGIGVLGNVPLGQSAALYGNLAFLSLEQEFSDNITGSSPSFDMVGASFEIGGAFAFTRWLSSNIGFKYQSLWGEDTDQDDHSQDFYGLTLGLNVTF